MGKRYYCEYCDKSFADSPVNRKKHVNGIQHHRNRKLHYDSFKDPAELLAEEAQKLPCKRFFQTGSCDFGASCRYSHTSPQLLLQSQSTSVKSTSASTHVPEPKIAVWLARWEKKIKSEPANKKSKMTAKNPASDYQEPGVSSISKTFSLPANLPVPLSQLPPSLLPPPPQAAGYPNLPKLEWG